MQRPPLHGTALAPYEAPRPLGYDSARSLTFNWLGDGPIGLSVSDKFVGRIQGVPLKRGMFAFSRLGHALMPLPSFLDLLASFVFFHSLQGNTTTWCWRFH